MPYDLKTKSGVVLRNIPDDVSPDAPELRQLAAAQFRETPKYKEALAAQRAQDQELYAPTRGMNWGERALANVGAGFDTARQGVQQLAGKVGIGGGVADEEIKEKRERDEALAQSTTGGGVLQLVGEAAPTAVVPFGTFAKGGSVLAKTLGARGAANALSKGTTRAVADSAAAGAAGAALGPTLEDESRAGNAAIGATFGAALPAAGRVVREGYERVTKSGAANRASRLAREAAGDVDETGKRLAGYDMRKGDPDAIPLTSAAASQNAGLARLEQAARTQMPEKFLEGDQTRAKRVYERVMADTGEAEQLAARKAERRAEWDSNWQTAEQLADPEVFAGRMQQLVPNLQQALRSPEASNPAVRGVLEQVLGEVERLGEGFTPAHLQQIRANLNARGKAIPTNAYQAAPRESAAVNSLITELDDTLNKTTGDAWDAVRGGYERSSRGVDASKAAGRVRESFIDPQTNRVRGVAADLEGDVPQITEAGLGRAMDASRSPDKRSLLSEPARGGLEKTLQALRQQGIVQRLKKTSTAGGGSDTASNLMATGLADMMPGGGLVRLGIGEGMKFANKRRDEILADALRDPRAMQELLTRASRTPGDLTAGEKALLQALRSYTAVGASNQTER